MKPKSNSNQLVRPDDSIPKQGSEPSNRAFCREREKDFDRKFGKSESLAEMATRLIDAFETLDGCGIMTRANYECCQSCEFASIQKEIDDDLKKDWGWDGFAFYHAQDAENLLDNGIFHISYGGVTLPDEEIAERVVAVLREFGIDTH